MGLTNEGNRSLEVVLHELITGDMLLLALEMLLCEMQLALAAASSWFVIE